MKAINSLRTLLTCLIIISIISEVFSDCSCSQELRNLRKELKDFKKWLKTERKERRVSDDALRKDLQNTIKISQHEIRNREERMRQDLLIGDKMQESKIRDIQEKVEQLMNEGIVLREKVEKLMKEDKGKKNGGGNNARVGTDTESSQGAEIDSQHGVGTDSPQRSKTPNPKNGTVRKRKRGQKISGGQGMFNLTVSLAKIIEVWKAHSMKNGVQTTTTDSEDLGVTREIPLTGVGNGDVSSSGPSKDAMTTITTTTASVVTCGQPTIHDNTVVRYLNRSIDTITAFPFDAQLLVRCKTASQFMTGKNLVSCELGGWSSSLPKCEATNAERDAPSYMDLILVVNGRNIYSCDDPVEAPYCSMTDLGAYHVRSDVLMMITCYHYSYFPLAINKDGGTRNIGRLTDHPAELRVTITSTSARDSGAYVCTNGHYNVSIDVAIFLSGKNSSTNDKSEEMTTGRPIDTCEHPTINDRMVERYRIVKYLNRSIDDFTSFPRGSQLLTRCQYVGWFVMTGNNIVTCEGRTGWSSPLPTCVETKAVGNAPPYMALNLKPGSTYVYNCEDQPSYSTTCSVTDLGVYHVKSNILMDISCDHYSRYPTAIYKDDNKTNLSHQDPAYRETKRVIIRSTSASDSGRYTCTNGDKTVSINVLIVDKVNP